MKTVILTLSLVSAVVLAGCASNEPPSTSTGSTPPTGAASGLSAQLTGSGSTFVAPLMDKWRTDFTSKNSGVQISYTGGGSGKGRTDVSKSLVDFAASDAPMKDEELANATDVLHVPVAAGGVAIAYNLPEVSGTPLKFDAAVIAGMFLGTITKWNDPALVALNPGVSLPDQEIAIVHRSDGSGTTATFTDYLNKADARWKKDNGGPGSGSTVNWPVGTGANGNNGVGAQIQQIPYSLGYLGSEWSDVSKVQTGLVKNKAGKFVAPTPAAVSAALDAGLKANAFDDKLRGSVTDMDGDASYPIAAVTWALVHQHQTDAAKGKALKAFLTYALHEGQSFSEGLNYAPIPASLVTKAQAVVDTVQ